MVVSKTDGPSPRKRKGVGISHTEKLSGDQGHTKVSFNLRSRVVTTGNLSPRSTRGLSKQQKAGGSWGILETVRTFLEKTREVTTGEEQWVCPVS